MQYGLSREATRGAVSQTGWIKVWGLEKALESKAELETLDVAGRLEDQPNDLYRNILQRLHRLLRSLHRNQLP